MIKNWLGFYTLIRRETKRMRRVIGQVIIAPLITASLYIFVFGYVIGSSIDSIEGIKYISFVFPGVFAMNLILAVFSGTSSNIFFMKFQKALDDMLTLPISYFELVLSLVANGVIRGFAITVSLSLVAILFGVNTIAHPFILIGYVFLIGALFGLLGIVLGIWSGNSFEKISGITNFLLTPLTFLGGTFYSIKMLPENLQFLAHFNPVFYAVDGIRYSLTGYHDSPIWLGLVVLFGLTVVVTGVCVWIFRTGWNLRS